GVPYCRTEYAGTPDEAADTAERLGLPVVLKTAATLAHKTELGGGRAAPPARAEYAGPPDEAADTAERLGLPVVLKTAATLAHKTELGGVRTALADPIAVRNAYHAITGAIPGAGVLVQ